jgi:sigma-B regulation protein RsbU (phosphoserine phosphatase)
MVVGAFPFAKYNESRVELLRGDLLVFYTDGISEPENAYGEMFGEDRIIELAIRNAHCDESQIVSAIADAVREWTGSDELQDDMTLLLARQL